MRRIISAVLMTLLAVPPVSAGQRLGAWIDWDTARSLKAGTEVRILTVADGPPVAAWLLLVTDSTLVTFRADAPKLSAKVQRVLCAAGPAWPVILDDRGTFVRGKVRVSQEGIFDGDHKLAELSQVVQQTPRVEVRGLTRVEGLHRGRYVLLGMLAGGALVIGLLAGILSGVS